MQIGTFDFSGFSPSAARTKSPRIGAASDASNAAEALSWPDTARHVYGRNFTAQSTSGISPSRIRGLKGSSLKQLHHAVFDVIDGSISAESVRIGLGASMYGFVGRWVPRTMLAWVMGIRKVDQLSTWQPSPSPTGSNADSSANDDDQKDKDFLSIHHDTLDSPGVWRQAAL